MNTITQRRSRGARRIACWLAAATLCFGNHVAVSAETIALWDFSRGMQGWEANSFVTALQPSAEGLPFSVRSPDPFLTSPPVECPPGRFLIVTLRMRSTGSGNGQLYLGPLFSESNSREFSVRNDGEWQDYRVVIPSPGVAASLRLDPGDGVGKVVLAWVRIEADTEPPVEAWAAPRELRNKKFIGGGLYTTYGGETAITPRFIAQHPDFADSYPFDGIVLPVVLSPEWVRSLSLTKLGKPWLPQFLNELIWTRIRIPDEAVAQSLDDLKRMRRGRLTDNFLIIGMVDGARGLKTPDLADDADWAIIEHNAALAARLCREGKLKGFWLDTEQYGFYRWRTESVTPEFDPKKPQELHFPLGKDTPAVLRRRGAQWIKAVQAECPDVKIMTTFAWSPDSNVYGPLTGVIPFLDGVLEGIQAPSQIIHAHENTFYFGQAKGTTHTYATEHGFPGDRNRYAAARASIQGWRSLSKCPDKYEAIVRVGMAAWVEDHPWNVPEGWPIGGKASLWSNLPLALAYTDEYVWVWSEHTKYGQPSLRDVNPFLASLNNQTFNTGQEAVAAFTEDFSSDPLLRGWYFDFDMLAIGRKAEPSHEATVMSTESLPYRWDRHAKALNVFGVNPTRLSGQRRRFVRPLRTEATQAGFRTSFDFRIAAFGSEESNPISMGLFNSDRAMDAHSLTLQIARHDSLGIFLQLQGTQQKWPLSFPGGLKAGPTYRFTLSLVTASRELRATLESLPAGTSQPQEVQVVLPEAFFSTCLDEVGVALVEAPRCRSLPETAYRYSVSGLKFSP